MVVSARPARALTSGAARRRRDCVAWGVIVVRQGNRAVLLRRVRSRRRPPDGGASAGVGPWQARRLGGGNGPDMRRILPVVGVVVLVLVLGFVVLGSCSGSSAADQYRSYVQDVNSVARQSNTDAKALDAALYNQELTPDQVITKVASFIPKARATETTASALKPHGQDQAAGSPALPAAGAAIPHAGAAGPRGGAQEGAARQEGRRPGHRGSSARRWPTPTAS